MSQLSTVDVGSVSAGSGFKLRSVTGSRPAYTRSSHVDLAAVLADQDPQLVLAKLSPGDLDGLYRRLRAACNFAVDLGWLQASTHCNPTSSPRRAPIARGAPGGERPEVAPVPAAATRNSTPRSGSSRSAPDGRRRDGGGVGGAPGAHVGAGRGVRGDVAAVGVRVLA